MCGVFSNALNGNECVISFKWDFDFSDHVSKTLKLSGLLITMWAVAIALSVITFHVFNDLSCSLPTPTLTGVTRQPLRLMWSHQSLSQALDAP